LSKLRIPRHREDPYRRLVHASIAPRGLGLSQVPWNLRHKTGVLELKTDTSANFFLEPPDLLQFVSTEQQQFMTSLVNCREEVDFIRHLHGLHHAAMARQ